jgi:type IV pilus assembly protein PilV
MLEVLISVLLVSTVLLALALLQVVSLRGSNSSYVRTSSVVLANDIAEKMRANQPGLAGYAIALATPGTGGTRAGDDVVNWKTSLATALPAGDGSIVVASGVATITVEWFDSASPASDDQTATASTNTRLVMRSTL